MPVYYSKFITVVCLVFVVGALELATLGMLVPMIKGLLEPEFGFTLLQKAQTLYQSIGLFTAPTTLKGLYLVASLVFITLATAGVFLRLLLSHLQIRLAFDCGKYVSVLVFRNIVRRPYSELQNSSAPEMLSAANEKAGLIVSHYFSPIINCITAGGLGLLLVVAMIWLDWIATLITLSALGTLYLMYGTLMGRYTRSAAQSIDKCITQKMRLTNDCFRAIEDIKVNGLEESTVGQYREIISTLHRRIGNLQAISTVPRILIEGSLFVFIGIWISRNIDDSSGSFLSTIPYLAAIAFGALKLIPIFQQLYSSWSTLRGSGEIIRTVMAYVAEPTSANTSLALEDPIDSVNTRLVDKFGDGIVSVSFSNVSYCLDRTRPIIRNATFELKRGDFVGIYGSSGSGKSTLLRVMNGLLRPTEGEIRFNGEEIAGRYADLFRVHGGYVPQNVYVFDSSMDMNITCLAIDGTKFKSESDANIHLALESARLDEFVRDDYSIRASTRLGDGGGRISGGQRQRIGLARIFYKRPSFALIDEGTIGLDSDTEQQVMQNLRRQFSRGICVVVTHNEGLSHFFNRVFRLDCGVLKETNDS